jgi:hypothetical protein
MRLEEERKELLEEFDDELPHVPFSSRKLVNGTGNRLRPNEKIAFVLGYKRAKSEG